MARKYTDGRAIDVTIAGTRAKGDAFYGSGFHGFLMDSGVAGDQVALDTASQVWEVTIPAALAAAKGAILNILTDGTHTIVASGTVGSVPFLRVVEAKDANNVIIAKHLAQPTV